MKVDLKLGESRELVGRMSGVISYGYMGVCRGKVGGCCLLLSPANSRLIP